MMLRKIVGTLPPYLTLFGAIMSALLPFVLYKINETLHKYGDPPWKKKP